MGQWLGCVACDLGWSGHISVALAPIIKLMRGSWVDVRGRWRPSAPQYFLTRRAAHFDAVLALICPTGEINGIEIVSELARYANANLSDQFPNSARVCISLGDSLLGIPG